MRHDISRESSAGRRFSCYALFFSKIRKDVAKFVVCLIACWEILHFLHSGKFCILFRRLLIFFSKSTLSKNSLMNITRVSNSLDPHQARHLSGPDLGSNSLQR